MRNSSAFARGHGARGAATGDSRPGRGLARGPPGLGAAAAGPGAEESESKPAHAGLWGPLGTACAGEPEPCTPIPEMGVPERRRQRRSGAGKGSPFPAMTRALPPGLLELSPVERGVVSIFGVASRFFVAMSNKGKLYGSVSTAGARRAPAEEHGQDPDPPGRRKCGAGSQDRRPLTPNALGRRPPTTRASQGVQPQDSNIEVCAIPEWAPPSPSKGAIGSPSLSPWAVSQGPDGSLEGGHSGDESSGCQVLGRWLGHQLL